MMGNMPWFAPNTRRAIDEDGYEIVPDRSRGLKCGRCGMRFDHDKAYGYVCSSGGCPMMLGGSS